MGEDRRGQVGFVQPGDGVAEGADAGQHHLVGLGDAVRVAGDRRRRGRPSRTPSARCAGWPCRNRRSRSRSCRIPSRFLASRRLLLWTRDRPPEVRRRGRSQEETRQQQEDRRRRPPAAQHPGLGEQHVDVRQPADRPARPAASSRRRRPARGRTAAPGRRGGSAGRCRRTGRGRRRRRRRPASAASRGRRRPSSSGRRRRCRAPPCRGPGRTGSARPAASTMPASAPARPVARPSCQLPGGSQAGSGSRRPDRPRVQARLDQRRRSSPAPAATGARDRRETARPGTSPRPGRPACRRPSRPAGFPGIEDRTTT